MSHPGRGNVVKLREEEYGRVLMACGHRVSTLLPLGEGDRKRKVVYLEAEGRCRSCQLKPARKGK